MEKKIIWLMDYYAKNKYPINELNLFGIRDISEIENDVINDYLGFFTKEEVFICKGTTDPSVYFTLNKMERNKSGTFHLKEGFHSQIWCVGTHKGYEALVNDYKFCKPTAGWRDANYNFTQDPSDIEVCDYFGVNFHRMHPVSIVNKIGRYSAGCQVVQNPKDFNYILKKIKSSKMFYGTKAKTTFNYMLFNISEIDTSILNN